MAQQWIYIVSHGDGMDCFTTKKGALDAIFGEAKELMVKEHSYAEFAPVKRSTVERELATSQVAIGHILITPAPLHKRTTEVAHWLRHWIGSVHPHIEVKEVGQ